MNMLILAAICLLGLLVSVVICQMAARSENGVVSLSTAKLVVVLMAIGAVSLGIMGLLQIMSGGAA